MYEWYFLVRNLETQAKKAAARKTTSVAQEQHIGEHDDYEMEIDDDSHHMKQKVSAALSQRWKLIQKQPR